eukprot:TRINITY_DN3435_c2_g1_i1.p1 TRINITY_DN3435_c2_g1~~TRINITY_DN3435_c2_g1_i1.p1  ORF type:complete len:527 (+),score=115.22 TRINITY_DN3435_c2_g1_i1:51-1631(+)
MMYQQQEHTGTSKVGVSTEREAARRRGDAATLRAKKKEEMMREKRGKVNESESIITGSAPLPTADVKSLPEYVVGVRQGDPERRQLCTTLIRKLLSKANEPPIKQVIETGVVEDFTRFLSAFEFPKLQLEAAWAICNIASGTEDETNYIIQLNTVPQFMQLLTTANEDLLDQCLWALGNIAGEPSGKMQMLELDALKIIQQIVHNNPSETILRNATWCMSNLVRKEKDAELANKTLPLIMPVLPTFRELLTAKDKQVVCDACWALSYVSDGNNNRIQLVMQLPEIVPTLMRIVAMHDSQLCSPALRTLGNFATGTDEQTQQVINAGLLHTLKKILSSPNTKEGVVNECCWTISNILLGTDEQRACVFKSELHVDIISYLQHSKLKIKKECVHGIANIAEHGTQEEKKIILEYQCMKGLHFVLQSLKDTSSSLAATILRAMETLLTEAPGIDEILIGMQQAPLDVLKDFREDGGFVTIESFLESRNEDIAASAQSIYQLSQDGVGFIQGNAFGLDAPQQNQPFNISM